MSEELKLRVLTDIETANIRKYLRINDKGELFLLDGTQYTIQFYKYVKSNLIMTREFLSPKLTAVYNHVRSWCY